MRVPAIDLIDEWEKESKTAEENGVRNRAGSGSWWGWTGNVDWDQLRAVLLNDLVPESPPSLPMNISPPIQRHASPRRAFGGSFADFHLENTTGPISFKMTIFRMYRIVCGEQGVG